MGKGDGGATVSSEFPWGKASAVVPGAHLAVCEALEHILFPEESGGGQHEGPEFIRSFRPLHPLWTFWENQKSRSHDWHPECRPSFSVMMQEAAVNATASSYPK